MLITCGQPSRCERATRRAGTADGQWGNAGDRERKARQGKARKGASAQRGLWAWLDAHRRPEHAGLHPCLTPAGPPGSHPFLARSTQSSSMPAPLHRCRKRRTCPSRSPSSSRSRTRRRCAPRGADERTSHKSHTLLRGGRRASPWLCGGREHARGGARERVWVRVLSKRFAWHATSQLAARGNGSQIPGSFRHSTRSVSAKGKRALAGEGG